MISLTLTLILVKIRARTRASPSPRFGASGAIDEVAGEMESSQRATQSWLKAACLSRDGNCCVISGLYDVDRAIRYLDKAAYESWRLQKLHPSSPFG